MRILHVSDLHVSLPWRAFPLSTWCSKRVAGAINLLLGRGRHYVDAARKAAALDDFRRAHDVDLVLCTGDFTAFGTRAELERAHAALAPLFDAPLGFVGMPGNHDVYTADVVRGGFFEEFFSETLRTDLPDLAVDGRWPLVRLFGDDVAVVAVNSARPRPVWSSTGRVPHLQLEGLRAALADERVRSRFTFVMTHYAPCIEGGLPDKRLHRFENADAYLAACAGVERGALLCGHVHRRFTVPADEARPLPLFCAGSTTKDGREGLWLFDVADGRVTVTPGRWAGAGYALEEAEGGPQAALRVDPHRVG